MITSLKPFFNRKNIAFCRNLSSTESISSSIGTFNHHTCMFREPKTDEFVQTKIKDMAKDKTVNVVYGACSSGEEVMSYLIMLDEVFDNLNMSAFDVDSECVSQAKTGKVMIVPQDGEKFLLGNGNRLKKYQKSVFEKFYEYFKPTGLTKTPEDNPLLLFLRMTNPVRYINEFKKQTSYEFQIDPDVLQRVCFLTGDIKNLEKMYQKNSVDVLLFRNAMYHLLCCQNSYDARVERMDSKFIADDIARQMSEVMKTGGLVVFGERENKQGFKQKTIAKAMLNHGFKPVDIDINSDGEISEEKFSEEHGFKKRYNVWKKVN